MEFTNFYNIKTEQTVNPFLHLASRAGIPGLVTTSAPATSVHTKQEHATQVHYLQVPALHQQQQQHHVQQPANDTAFPGAAPIRHNTTIIQQRAATQAQHVIQPAHAQYTIKQQPGGGTEQIHIKTAAYTPAAAVAQPQPVKEKPPKERIYKCGDCDKAFVREEHLKRHTFTHTGHSKHTCEVPGCNKTYSTKDLLTNHLKHIHLGVQPERAFLCIDCGKDFVRRDHLQRHRKNVHGTGPMAAAAAAAAGIPANQLSLRNPPLQHAIATTPLAPAQPIAVKSERGKGKERRFHCNLCGKDFIRKDHLQRHAKKVHHVGEPGGPVVGAAGAAATPATVAVSVPMQVAAAPATVTLAHPMSIAN